MESGSRSFTLMEDGQGMGRMGESRKRDVCLGLHSYCFPHTLCTVNSLVPGVFILQLPFPEAVLGPWDPAKTKQTDTRCLEMCWWSSREQVHTHLQKGQWGWDGREWPTEGVSEKPSGCPLIEAHVSPSVSTMWTFSLEKDICCYHLFSGKQLRSGPRHKGQGCF